MPKKSLFYLALQVTNNFLWAWWVLPSIHEEGTVWQTLNWLLVQALLPVLLAMLLVRRRRYAFVFLLLYSVFILLYGCGLAGWALIGAATPYSLYVVCGSFFVVGFGLLYQSLKGMKVGRTIRRFEGDRE